jgi:hypothetical protein
MTARQDRARRDPNTHDAGTPVLPAHDPEGPRQPQRRTTAPNEPGVPEEGPDTNPPAPSAVTHRDERSQRSRPGWGQIKLARWGQI